MPIRDQRPLRTSTRVGAFILAMFLTLNVQTLMIRSGACSISRTTGSIEGAFDQKNPAGFGGGALPGGIGWYRKTFDATPVEGKSVFIDFDGVYRNSEVWLNGQYLGKRPYGYSSFQYDLTPHLKAGKNIIAVKVDNSQQPNSRWYSGSGIYRNVWLTN